MPCSVRLTFSIFGPLLADSIKCVRIARLSIRCVFTQAHTSGRSSGRPLPRQECDRSGTGSAEIHDAHASGRRGGYQYCTVYLPLRPSDKQYSTRMRSVVLHVL